MSSHHSPSLWRRCLVVLAVVSIFVAACGQATTSPARSDTSALPSAVAPSQSASSSPSIAVGPPPSCSAAASASPVAAPWWRDRVFYEVFVRSFADSNGDGIGDLRGLRERLDYLNDGDPATATDLGVTALWLMPVAESPSYHGYDVTDYKAIEDDYGTVDDFKALMIAAHERGIDIVVDLVLNHTSVQHPWFQDSRTAGSEHADWYIWRLDHPGYAGPGGNPVWHGDGDRFYYGYFWEGMPDLNVANPAVTAALDDVARFWLDDLGVDGFRLDAARHLVEAGEQLDSTPETFAWLEAFRGRVEAVKPEALLVGEVWDATSTSSRYVKDGALDMAFEFGLASAMVSGVKFGDPRSLATAQAEVVAAYPPGGYATFLTNHDQDRVFDQLNRDVPSAKAAATLLLTGTGVPFVYYGEELGMRGRKPDERIRTPLAWTATAPGYGFTTGTPWEAMAEGIETANIAAETADPGSLLSHYRALIALRTAHPVLRDGELLPVKASDSGVYAHLRHQGGETVAVVVNLSKEPVAALSLSLAAGPLCGTLSARALLAPAGAATGPAAPVVNTAGGFEAWAIGPLGPHESLVVALGH